MLYKSRWIDKYATGFGLNCAHISHCFRETVSVCHYAISELCKGLCTITTESGTSPHASSDSPASTTGASAAAWSMRLPHQRCGDGEVSGSGVSEGVCEAPTFMEWSAMVVPTDLS